MLAYEYRHIVTFQETNLVGNVYYTHHLDWQGRCRELFLREHAPEIIEQLDRELSLATVRCSCEYFSELMVFDEIVVRMRLAEMIQNRLTLTFDYWRINAESDELIARGEQQVACMRREGEQLVPTGVPPVLRAALAPYGQP
jgi:enediyne biosynthesis thioesterase